MLELELKSIKGKKKFEDFFNHADKFYAKDAALFVTYKEKSRQESENIVEFAVTVRKKQARKAVVRNRIKRLMRECLRQLGKDNSSAKLHKQFDMFILVWANAPKHPQLIKQKDVCPVIKKLLDKANKNVEIKGKEK